MLQKILAIIVFIAALAFTYLGWQWTGGKASGAVMGFVLIAAPGFYYVFTELPKQLARRKELKELKEDIAE